MIQDFGRYNLLSKLGEGGMGAVYLARQKILKRYCAIKVVSAQHAGTPEMAERFLREARAAAGLSHPHLVSVFDCDQFNGQYFIAMEYIEGLSIGEILRAHGALPISLALHWLEQAATALEYVHAKNIIHRDIKPDNMMINADAEVKIMDLGLAKTFADGETTMTMTGYGMGTPHYMSPEQINDAKSADARSDIYSLGISFFHMLVGKQPFIGTSAAAIYVMHLHEPMPSVGFEDAELTQQLDALIGRMTAKERTERFQSMTELREALRPWRAHFPLDNAAQEFCAKLDPGDRTIALQLLKNSINPAMIDSDASRATLTPNMGDLSRATPAPSLVAPPPKRNPALWVGAAIAVAAVVLAIAYLSQKSREELTPQQSPAPVAQTPPPAPTPTPQPVAHIAPPAPAAPKTGSLFVITEPKNAFVLFGGKTKMTETGAVSFEDVPVGTHKVEVTLPGYYSVTQDVRIADGEITKQNFILQRIAGWARIESQPEGADVIMDGKLIGKTPCVVRGGDGDKSECLLRLQGYDDANVAFTIKESGATEKVQLVQKPQPVAANPPPAVEPPVQPQPQPQLPQPTATDPRRITPQELHQYLSTLLDRARRAPLMRWQQIERAMIQADIQNYLISRAMPQDTAARIAAQMMSVMDAAVNVPEASFGGNVRGQYLHQMMEKFRLNTGGASGQRPPPPDENLPRP
jgi:serine/threonine protein kinase